MSKYQKYKKPASSKKKDQSNYSPRSSSNFQQNFGYQDDKQSQEQSQYFNPCYEHFIGLPNKQNKQLTEELLIDKELQSLPQYLQKDLQALINERVQQIVNEELKESKLKILNKIDEESQRTHLLVKDRILLHSQRLSISKQKGQDEKQKLKKKIDLAQQVSAAVPSPRKSIKGSPKRQDSPNEDGDYSPRSDYVKGYDIKRNPYLSVMGNSLYGYPAYSPYHNPNILPFQSHLNPLIEQSYMIEQNLQEAQGPSYNPYIPPYKAFVNSGAFIDHTSYNDPRHRNYAHTGPGYFAENQPLNHFKATPLPPEPIDPVYQYFDPISVSLQERVKLGGSVTAHIDNKLSKPIKHLFNLRLLGEENLSQNEAADIAARLLKHEYRVHKQGGSQIKPNEKKKTGGWGCGLPKQIETVEISLVSSRISSPQRKQIQTKDNLIRQMYYDPEAYNEPVQWPLKVKK